MESLYFDRLLGNYFLDDLKKAGLFKRINSTGLSGPENNKKLLDEGYDSLIELDIKELALRKEYGDKLKICANVWGKMTDLKSGELVWNRQEVVMADDEYTIEAYKSNRGQILKESADQVFRKIARRLANDFIYSR